jgi:hypothetical protein
MLRSPETGPKGLDRGSSLRNKEIENEKDPESRLPSCLVLGLSHENILLKYNNILFICFFYVGTRLLCTLAVPSTSSLCRALRRCVTRCSGLGPAAGMVARLVGSVPIGGTSHMEDPLHVARLFPDLFCLRILAWKPSNNRFRLPA